MIKNCVYSTPGSCGKVYKCETIRLQKVSREPHQKVVCRGEIKKLGMADNIDKEKENHLPWQDEVRLIVSKLATVVEEDLKAPFSIATTPRYREGRYYFPLSVPLYPWSIPYSAKC